MNNRELRIGNYIKFNNRTIWEVGINDFEFVSDLRFTPIPLTEEWLERFGFEKTFENPFQKHEWQFKYFTLDEKMCPYLGRYTDDTPFKYVHQLQNLYFALTGEELTIR